MCTLTVALCIILELLYLGCSLHNSGRAFHPNCFAMQCWHIQQPLYQKTIFLTQQIITWHCRLIIYLAGSELWNCIIGTAQREGLRFENRFLVNYKHRLSGKVWRMSAYWRLHYWHCIAFEYQKAKDYAKGLLIQIFWWWPGLQFPLKKLIVSLWKYTDADLVVRQWIYHLTQEYGDDRGKHARYLKLFWEEADSSQSWLYQVFS